MFKALVGQNTFQHRREQANQIVSRLTLCFIAGTMGNIGVQRRPQNERATGFIEGADIHEVAADIRMHNDRIGLLVRCSRT